jgi:hypothetical protein
MPFMSLIVVRVAFDSEAGVWFVESSDLAGLNVEARTVEEIQRQIPLAVVDLLEGPNWDGGDFDVPIEIVAHASARARSAAAA